MKKLMHQKKITDEEQSTIEESPKYVTADKRSIGYDYVYSWNGLAQG